MSRNIKKMGQVYTPHAIVCDILDTVGYNGVEILDKHIMENSCGPGAFLIEIVERYIKTSFDEKRESELIKANLETFIHAIDIDHENVCNAKKSLTELAERYGIENVAWDVKCADSLTVNDYDDKMDYVVGNPPYIRVHNLENSYNSVKKYKFAQDGMTDIYIVFFEIGLKMLRDGGKLSYITPSSYYNSKAGTALRRYIQSTQSVYRVMDLGHYNPFEETTYTTITAFCKGIESESVQYYAYDLESGRPTFIDSIPYVELFVNGDLFLMENSEKRKQFARIYNIDRKNNTQIQVKNGFATLADSVFIGDNFEGFDNTIDVIKGSTGSWKKCIYPYDENGVLLPFEKLSPEVRDYLMANREKLDKRDADKNQWYAFGRTQALKDVSKYKVAVNTLFKDLNSLKINELPPGKGVYSGLYILSDFSLEDIKSVLSTQDFIDYIKAIKKYKSGGYYTFSTEDLNKYLLYKLCNIRNNNTQLTLFTDIGSSAQLSQ